MLFLSFVTKLDSFYMLEVSTNTLTPPLLAVGELPENPTLSTKKKNASG